MGEPIHGAPQPPTIEQGYEHSDVPFRPLLIFLAILAGTLVVVSALMAGLFFWFEAGAAEADPLPAPLADKDRQTPGPLLQVSPREDLDDMRAREQRQLTTPAWVDKDRGVARIPIDRAIALTTERGLPNWPAVEITGEQDPAEQKLQTPEARQPGGTGQETPVQQEGEL